MGQKLSQTKENIVIKVFLEKYFPNFQLIQILNNGMMYKTLLIKKNKAPLVVKIFIKKYYDESDSKIFSIEKENLISIHKKIFKESIPPSIAPIINIEDNDLCGMIFRQYFEYSLKERMYLNPYLNEIEKIWITFQLLQNFKILKNMDIIHGDLTPENILLTSNLSVYISDIASFKPDKINADDIASYTYYFGSNDNTSLKGFYLAPERIVEKNSNNISNNKKTFAMDVFSLGVIIAELFIEKNIFTFPAMVNYKSGNIKLFNIEEFLNRIKHEKIKTLIKKMIEINPDKRITIEKALNDFLKEICPNAMKGFLIHFNVIINNSIFWQPDLIIGYIYRYWKCIWKMIFGKDDEPINLNSKLNLEIMNLLNLKNPINLNTTKSLLKKDANDIFYYDQNKYIINLLTNELIDDKENVNKNINEKDAEIINKYNKDCVLIIINYLVKNMKNVKYESSNLVAMEMVKNLSSKLDDIFNLKNIIPYFVDNLERKSFTTKLITINYIFEILYSFKYENLDLPVTEYNYFDSYIFPALLKLYYSGKHELILEFFNDVDKMIDIEEKFLNITLKSRISKYKKSLGLNNNKNNNNNKEINRTLSFVPKKMTAEVIFKDYETSLKLFKDELFRVINEILIKNEEIDILIIAIRKLPKLISFYIKSKSGDFIKFILNNFNKNWIIQKEILIQIPKMVVTLGEKVLNDCLLFCIEMLVTNNSNEIKIYELIKTIHELLKMGYLQHDRVVSIFIQLIPYLVHPNLLIRKELINLTKSLINYLTKEEIIALLLQNLKDYFTIPINEINSKNIDDILNYKKIHLNRILFQLELNQIFYDKNIINNAEQISLPLLKDIIELGRKGDINSEDIGDGNYSYDKVNMNNDFISKIKSATKYILSEKFDEYINYLKKNTDEEDSIYNRIDELIGKIFWICSEPEEKNNKKNQDFFYDENNSLLSSKFFNFLKIFKILGISMKLFNFNKLNEIVNSFKENYNNSNQIANIKENENNLSNNFYYNKSFSNFRPQGQLLSTLYFHKTNPVLKLIPLSGNKICSFDSSGTAILFTMFKKEDNFHTKKEYIFKSQSPSKTPILYKNCITLLDNLYFVTASKNILYQYEPEYSNQTATELCKIKTGANITCLESFGKDSMELQKIIFCTEKGEVKIYDQRTRNVSLGTRISFDSGKPLCISKGFKSNGFYIGTMGGKILRYDLRFNSISNELNYYNNDPIISVMPYRCNKLNIGDLFNGNDINNDIYDGDYLVISAESKSYEVGFWNINSLDCDILLKVNNVRLNKEAKDKNVFLNDIEYPFTLKDIIFDKYNLTKKNDISKDYLGLNKYNYLTNYNYIKTLSLKHMYDDLYINQCLNLEKIKNINNNINTVRCLVSPFYDKYISNNSSIKYYNSPYIITGGNDKIIRYWDLSKEGINNINGNNLSEKGSYIINAPDDLTYSNFSKSIFNNFVVLQSNESFDNLGKKTNLIGFSEYQNYNGITIHSSVQDEFDPSCQGDLKYATKISDASHKGIITDVVCYGLNSDEGICNILVSCSTDGSIKIWK